MNFKINPLKVLSQATKDVPAVKYASGIAGILAVLAIALKQDIAHLEATDKMNQDNINDCYTRYEQIYQTVNSAWQELGDTE